MAAKDKYHEAVKVALIKEKWIIIHNPYILHVDNKDDWQGDLGAEKILATEKGSGKIAVEIKTFGNPSHYSDFHVALGAIHQLQICLTNPRA
ncbi:MAG: hypothetical protein JNN12_14655 [Bacteroidetes Order II. Incertae sedis bacterium]|nr:hypothetical protein [Bacteroidetes Order II. bacterium]